MAGDKLITIIMPSFRDPRILEAIASLRRFDDIDTLRIAVIDGGSDESLLSAIRDALTGEDVFVSERDRGIFDALNKGLDLVDTPYIGWLGADDLFTGAIKASDVVRALAEADLFVASTYIVRGEWIRRKTHAWPCGKGLVRFGLHNPHYSTFGRSALLKSTRFELDLLSSDIAYFLDIFAQRPKVVTTHKVLLLQAEGGFSTGSWAKAVRINHTVYETYRKRSNAVAGLLGVGVKTGYKVLGVIYYRLRKRQWPTMFPEAAPGAATTPARG